MLSARFLAAIGFATLAAPAWAAGIDETAQYSVTLGGTHIATVDISLTDDGAHYSMGLDAKITGLARLVASGTATATSSGVSTRAGFRADKFDMLIRASGEDYTTAITYAGGGVASFIVTPPILNNIDRVAIERKHLTAANDMMAPFVLRGGALGPDLCNKKMQVFTGSERFDLTLKYAKDDTATSKRTGYQGPVVVCTAHYTPISGHYTTSEITNYLADNERILIWYAPLRDTGYFIPYRALVTTDAGDLSMVLTSLGDR